MFLLYSKVIQLYIYIYILFHILFHCGLTQGIEYSSCAVQQDIVVYPSYI